MTCALQRLKQRLASMVILGLLVFTMRQAYRPGPVAAGISHSQFPTLAPGTSGPSVRAWQYILRAKIAQAGHSTYQPITGQFDTTTKQNTQNYAVGGGLGVVTPSVWEANVPTVLASSSPDYIRAVETLLSTRYDPSTGSVFNVTINGVLTTAEKNEIKAFQNDASLPQTGWVDLETWRNLTFHYVPWADAGNGWCTPSYSIGDHSGGGDKIYDPWVTDWVGTEIDEWGNAKNWFESLEPGIQYGDLRFTDANRAHGQISLPHDTHRTGMDIDVRPMRLDANQCNLSVSYRWSSYDFDDTVRLIKWLRLVAGDGSTSARVAGVKVIYFNDPDVWPEFAPGFIKKVDGHDDHLHVVFCTPVEGPNWAGNHTCD